MPGELTPAEYYHTYLSSQRRVERWVVETGKELEVRAGHGPDAPRAPDVLPIDADGADRGKAAALALPTPASTNVAPVRRRSRDVPARAKAREHVHEADAPTSRRHRSSGPSSKHRAHQPREGRSRSRPASGSKKDRTKRDGGDGVIDSARSRSKDARKSHRKHKQQQASSSLSTYLLYAALPVIYAMTGSPALLLLITIALCAGYIYQMEPPPKKLHA